MSDAHVDILALCIETGAEHHSRFGGMRRWIGIAVDNACVDGRVARDRNISVAELIVAGPYIGSTADNRVRARAAVVRRGTGQTGRADILAAGENADASYGRCCANRAGSGANHGRSRTRCRRGIQAAGIDAADPAGIDGPSNRGKYTADERAELIGLRGGKRLSLAARQIHGSAVGPNRQAGEDLRNCDAHVVCGNSAAGIFNNYAEGVNALGGEGGGDIFGGISAIGGKSDRFRWTAHKIPSVGQARFAAVVGSQYAEVGPFIGIGSGGDQRGRRRRGDRWGQAGVERYVGKRGGP